MKASKMLTLLGALTFICAGCGSDRGKTAKLERRLADADERIAELTATVDRLQQQVDALKGGDLQKKINDVVAREVQSRMSADIDKMVSARVDKRLGTDDEIGVKIRETAQQVVDAAEAKRQEDGRQQQGRFQQNITDQRQRRESQRLETIAKDLNLNDDQKKKLADSQAAVQTKTREAARKLMESGNADPNTILNGVKELQSEHFAEVKAFLTDEQYQSYTNRQSNMLNFFGGMGGFGRGGRQRGPDRPDQQTPPQAQPRPTTPPPEPAGL